MRRCASPFIPRLAQAMATHTSLEEDKILENMERLEVRNRVKLGKDLGSATSVLIATNGER